jgi:hypothetical protein
MDQAAVFLSGSILTVLGFIIVAYGIVIINNIFHKYWKPFKIIKWKEPPRARFMTEDEVKEYEKKIR